jgi:hypothetical protein
MRFGPDDKLWVVTDPTPESRMEDIVFQASLRQIDLQFKGGLTMDRNPTLFTDEKEAKVEGYGRLVAMRASRAITQRLQFDPDAEVPERIEVCDGEGNVLFEADLRKGQRNERRQSG